MYLNKTTIFSLVLIIIFCLTFITFILMSQFTAMAQTAMPITNTSVASQNQVAPSGSDLLELAKDASVLLLPSIIALFGVIVTAMLGFRRVRIQLKEELHNEGEIIRQRLQADLEKEYQSRFNERKWEVYADFAKIIRDMISTLKESESKQKQEQKKSLRKLHDFVGDLWIVGSDDVVLAYNAWRATSSFDEDRRTEEQNSQVLMDLMQIIIEMRRDLGYSSSKIEPPDLLKTFINDLPEQMYSPQDKPGG